MAVFERAPWFTRMPLKRPFAHTEVVVERRSITERPPSLPNWEGTETDGWPAGHLEQSLAGKVVVTAKDGEPSEIDISKKSSEEFSLLLSDLERGPRTISMGAIRACQQDRLSEEQAPSSFKRAQPLLQ